MKRPVGLFCGVEVVHETNVFATAYAVAGFKQKLRVRPVVARHQRSLSPIWLKDLAVAVHNGTVAVWARPVCVIADASSLRTSYKAIFVQSKHRDVSLVDKQNTPTPTQHC